MVENICLSVLPLMPLYLGIYLVFLMRSDFDLSVAGTYGVASGITAIMLSHNSSPLLAITLSVLGAAALSLLTVAMYAWLRVPVFLGGLIMAIALYSVALRVMDKQPTISLITSSSIFDVLGGSSGTSMGQILLLAAVCALTFVVIGAFLKTQLGLALRVSGRNTMMARSNGFNERVGVCIALVVANGLAGLSGSLVVQTQRYAAVSDNVAAIIAGLGSVVIGAMILRPTSSKVVRMILAVILGGLIYESVIVLALQAGLDPVDLNLVTGLTLVAAIVIQVLLRSAVARVRGRSTGSFQLFDERVVARVSRSLTGHSE